METGETLELCRPLDRRSACAASLLAADGIDAGDRIAILCRNRVEFFEILFACAKLGAILVPLNWRMPASELDGLVADCTPKLIITGAEDRETAAALARTHSLASLDLETGYAWPPRCAGTPCRPPRPGRATSPGI